MSKSPVVDVYFDSVKNSWITKFEDGVVYTKNVEDKFDPEDHASGYTLEVIIEELEQINKSN